MLAIVGARSASQADGIRDYTDRLVDHLRASRTTVRRFVREPRAWTTRVTAVPGEPGPRAGSLAKADVVLLQYNPFSHGRRGFAPGLVLMLLALRCRRSRPTIALMVHETYVEARNWKWWIMRSWQRLQLIGLCASADIVFCSIQCWSEQLERSWPPAPVHHLPVASNLPDRRAARALGRERLGVTGDTLVLATFGLEDVGRITAYMLDAAEAVTKTGREVLLLGLGTDRPRSEQVRPGVFVHIPGFLPEEDVAILLSGTDLFLAPFMDGVSTRRTTVMAALQHEVAVVGTDGHLTDDVLRLAGHGLRLAHVDDRDGFVAAVCALAAGDRERRELALAGRAFYEERFDWPVLIERLLVGLRDRRANR